ncbi:MAG TPA: type II toxin-antitoxin system RelE/ParE family toxin [Cellvibrio sp.]|nr:type II toxin-antitoxin system RelE/ParE family toxin [Cellvibrio sp.]
MFHTIKNYILSPEAESDLGDIFDYTQQQFGIDQAATYLSELEENFMRLIANPQLGRERNEICEGLRSLTPSSHVIFYRTHDDHIRIIRILHGSRDLPKLF